MSSRSVLFTAVTCGRSRHGTTERSIDEGEALRRAYAGTSRRRATRPAIVLALGAAVALATLFVAAGQASPARHAAPVKGGTLKVLGQSDIFNLDTTSGYYTVNNILYRAYARQLLSYANSPSFKTQITLAPDIATVVPTTSNGGISTDGKTYTLHIKQGVKWSSKPPRQVTAADFVREFKLLCNPASPTGAPGYYTSRSSA